MPDLNEREQLVVNSCSNCKHCVSVCVGKAASQGQSIAHRQFDFCMVDNTSAEDRQAVVDETILMMSGGESGDCPYKLMDLLQLDVNDPDFRKSPRLVQPTNSCQFYEPREKKPAITKPEDIILLGKPLTEWNVSWVYNRCPDGWYSIDDWNKRVVRKRYEEEQYEMIGCEITTGKFHYAYLTTGEIIARTRFYVERVLDGLDMTPIIPYIEKALQYNRDYVELCDKIRPIFDELETKYGCRGRQTIDERFQLEFWQGAFSRHEMNPDRVPNFS